MGFWGVICEFDVARYRDVVIPAFRSGEQHPVIASAVANLNAQFPQIADIHFDGLADVMRSFTPDLDDSTLGRRFTAPAGWHHDELAMLYERVVLRETVRSWSNLARTGSFLRRLWDLDDRVSRGEVVVLYELEAGTSFWTVDGSGPVAWLDEEWTRLLAAELPAPDADASSDVGSDVDVGAKLVRDRQKQFWLVLDRAVRHGHGLLWGRDLTLAYRGGHLFADGRTPPVELGP